MAETNKIQKFVKENDIEVSDINVIAEAFGAPFEEAGEVLSVYENIKVTDESQTAEMKMAKEKRLILKKARTTVENKRKELKADFLKQGRAIDAVAKYVKEQIEPAEEYLQLQEDFVKIREEKAAAERRSKRLSALAEYEADPSLYNLEEMSDDQFDELIEKLDKDKKAKAKAEADAIKKAEEEAEAEKKRQAERDAENEKLKAEQAKKDAELKVAQEKTAKLEKEKAEAEAAAKAEAEKKAEAERKELAAPDKEKLLAFASKIRDLKPLIPAVKTDEARNLLKSAEDSLASTYTELVAGAEKL